jgi:hypothetical protein
MVSNSECLIRKLKATLSVYQTKPERATMPYKAKFSWQHHRSKLEPSKSRVFHSVHSRRNLSSSVGIEH